MTVLLALDLSVETITLLQRSDGGWSKVAEASCDPERIGTELRQLRHTARMLRGPTDGAVPVILILPDEQGTFLSIKDDVADIGTIAQRAAENGIDPSEVRLDWATHGHGTEVAAVARETLAAAETFVAAYGFTSAGTILAPVGADRPDVFWFGWSDLPPEAEAQRAEARAALDLSREDIRNAPPGPPPHAARPVKRAEAAARVDPAHLVPLEDDPDAQQGSRAQRAFWLSAVTIRKLWAGARVPRVLTRAAVWSVLLVAGLLALSFLPDWIGDPDDVAGDQPVTVDTAPARSEPVPENTRQLTENTGAPPPITAFDRSNAYTAHAGLSIAPPVAELGAFDLPGLDPELGADALTIPWPDAASSADPQALPAPPPPDQTFALDERGFVRPSAVGQRTPEGYLVVEGAPPRLPSQRPLEEDRPVILVAIDPATLPEDDPRRTLQPPVRPPDLVERFERARYGGRTKNEMVALRPVRRPLSAQESAPVSTAPTRLAIANGPRPASRPSDMTRRFLAAAKGNASESSSSKNTAQPSKSSSRQVASASTAAVDAPAVARASTARPTAPSSGSVTERATQKKSIDLSEVNLLGTFGASSRPRALVRMPGGRVVNVAVGDRVDGGRVSDIGKGQMRYVKSGRTVTLRMPNG